MVSQNTIERRASEVIKIINSGITVERIKKLTYQEYNQLFDVSIGKNILKREISQEQKDKLIEKSLQARFRLIDQISNKENKDIILQEVFKKQKIQNEKIQDVYNSEYDNIFITETVILELDDTTLLEQSGIKYPAKVQENTRYGVLEIEHETGKITFIKYHSKNDLENQLNIVKRNYGKIINIEFHGLRAKSQYITQEFADILSEFNR